MGRTIKITAIIAFALEVLYVIVGRFIIPLITGIIYSNRILSYSNEPVKTLLVSMGLYFGIVIIGLIIPLLYLVFMIYLIASTKSQKTGIAIEILGIVLMGGVIPLVKVILSLVFTPTISRLLSNWGSMDSYAIYATMNSSGAYVSILTTIGFVLLIMSFAFSISRKKWASDDIFKQGTEE